MSRKKRAWAWVIGISLLLISVWIGVRVVAFSKLRDAVMVQLDSLRQKGMVVQYDSFESNSWSNKIVLKGFKLENNSADSMCVQQLSFARCEVSGISLIALLLHREVQVDNLVLQLPVLRTTNNFLRHGKEPMAKANKINGVLIRSILIDSLRATIIDSATCQTMAFVSFSLTSSNLHLIMHDSLSGGTDKLSITKVTAKLPEQLYAAEILSATYDGIARTVEIDSVVITPLYSRDEFGRKAGKQIDRIEGMIPFLRATGVKGIAEMNHLTLQLRVDAFRDKRIRRKPRQATVLPGSFIRKLKFPVAIDSITISDSYISYEEFPESGSSSGKIFFNKLQARIATISNHTTRDAVMSATARFMDAGDLSAAFTFPADTRKPCLARGALSNFPLKAINGMLVPAANVEIQSGVLNELKFQFQYNEFRSDGEIEMFYSDLKINKLKKDAERSEDKILSILFDLVVKANLDKSDSKKKRTGTILWQRDPQRGIFNYWWKSLFTGIKSVQGIEKAQSSKPVRVTK